MPWLRRVEPTGVPVMLLHNYPYHREAGYLAQMFDNVYFDIGLGLNYAGSQSAQLIAESLEVAPFTKQRYSSDAWGPSELHFLGALLWRGGLARVSGRGVRDGGGSAGSSVSGSRTGSGHAPTPSVCCASSVTRTPSGSTGSDPGAARRCVTGGPMEARSPRRPDAGAGADRAQRHPDPGRDGHPVPERAVRC